MSVDFLERLLEIFPSDKSPLEINEIQKLPEIKVSKEEIRNQLSTLVGIKFIRAHENEKFSITDIGLDRRVDDKNEDYIYRRLNENGGSISEYQLAPGNIKFGSESNKKKVIENMFRSGRIRRIDDKTIEFTPESQEAQIAIFRGIVINELGKRIGIEIFWSEIVTKCNIPSHIETVLKYLLIDQGYIEIFKKTFMGDTIKALPKVMSSLYPNLKIEGTTPINTEASVKDSENVNETLPNNSSNKDSFYQSHKSNIDYYTKVITILGVAVSLGIFFGKLDSKNDFYFERENTTKQIENLQSDTVKYRADIRKLTDSLRIATKK